MSTPLDIEIVYNEAKRNLTTTHYEEPKWLTIRERPIHHLSPILQSWLLEEGSMTARLRAAAHEHFSVNKCFQGWQLPRPSEAKVLHEDPSKKAVIREVELLCDGEIWVCARSVFPEKALSGQGVRLHILENHPLGDLLYQDPTLTRSEFEIAQLKPSHQDYQRACQHLANPPKELWARRSIFHLYGQPILVSEIILPLVYGYVGV